MRKVLTFISTIYISIMLAVQSFAVADGEVRYTNELTSSPLRIFFAILGIIAFIVSEIAFEKIRERHVAKRNGRYEKNEDK